MPKALIVVPHPDSIMEDGLAVHPLVHKRGEVLVEPHQALDELHVLRPSDVRLHWVPPRLLVERYLVSTTESSYSPRHDIIVPGTYQALDIEGALPDGLDVLCQEIGQRRPPTPLHSQILLQEPIHAREGSPTSKALPNESSQYMRPAHSSPRFCICICSSIPHP